MRGLRLFVKCIAFSLLFFLLTGLLSFFLEPPRATFRVMMHEFYEQEQIDILFVGASRVRRGIDPFMIGEKLGGNAFSVAAGAQSPIDHYYIVKEAFKYYTPGLVVLDTSYAMMRERTRATSRLYLQEFRLSADKIAYMLDTQEPENYFQTLLPGLSGGSRNTYMRSGYSPWKNFQKKRSEAYVNYDYSYASNSISTYSGNGYLHSKNVLPEGRAGNMRRAEWKEEAMDPKKIKYYEKTFALCKEKGVPVIILDLPIPLAAVASQRGRAGYDIFMEELCRRNDVPYFNFQYIKKDVFHRKDVYYFDFNHLNYNGSQVFSPVLAQFLDEYTQGTLQTSDYFYSSYQEMLDDNRYIFNTWISYDEKTKKITAGATHGSGITPEYQFLYKENKSDLYQFVQLYDKNNVLLDYETGYIRVNCRPVGSDAGWQQYDEYKFEKPLA